MHHIQLRSILHNTLFAEPTTPTSRNLRRIKSSFQMISPPRHSLIYSPLPNIEIASTAKSGKTKTPIPTTECQTPQQCCCREKGVADICWGYCVDIKDTNYISRSLSVVGVCKKWFSIINYCTYCSHGSKEITKLIIPFYVLCNLREMNNTFDF